jgi:hypothetical protein
MKGNVNNVKMKLCPNWPSRTLWLLLVWALRLVLFAPADVSAGDHPARFYWLSIP